MPDKNEKDTLLSSIERRSIKVIDIKIMLSEYQGNNGLKITQEYDYDMRQREKDLLQCIEDNTRRIERMKRRIKEIS